MWKWLEKSCAYTMLSQSIPTFLIAMLATVLQKALRLRIWQELPRDSKARTIPVFDLVNCGPSTRFQTLGGLIVHNCLGLSYGMGPKKMCKQMYDFGFELSQRDAKAFHKAYWTLFSGVKTLGDKLAARVEREGYIINPFGYRLTPSPFKALNYFIQSSVSGIMHVFTAKLMAAAPWALWISCIHDELLIDVPISRLEEFRKAVAEATESMNTDLNWSVSIRTGFSPGDSWMTAK
jgi:hypothetical protein